MRIIQKEAGTGQAVPWWFGGLFLVLLWGCGDKKEIGTGQAVPRGVGVEVVAARGVPMLGRASGVVEARTRAVVAAQVMGVVRQAPVFVGQMVQAGQVLVVLDSQQLAAGVSQAEGARLEARSAVLESLAAIEAAGSQLELARSTRARLAALYERKSLAQQEMDEADGRVKQAEAALAMARARRTQGEARIAQADQAVVAASSQKGYATLVAPFAGVVTEKSVEVGAMAVPGAPLLTLERVGGFRVALQVDEKQAAGLRVGTPLAVRIENGAEMALKVTEIMPSIDAATRSLTVKADLPAVRELRSGAFAVGEWVIGQKEVLSVAAHAVRQSGQLQMVFVVDGGKARSRMVSLGEVSGGRREVLSGLALGEKVVVGLSDGIYDGVPIEVKP